MHTVNFINLFHYNNILFVSDKILHKELFSYNVLDTGVYNS